MRTASTLPKTRPEGSGKTTRPQKRGPHTTLSGDLTFPSTRPKSGTPLVFTGTGAELFRIWWPGWLLCIATFGLYWPFLLVKTRRYLLAHLFLEDFEFRYRGTVKGVVCDGLLPITTCLAVGVAVINKPELVPYLAAVCLFCWPVHLHYRWTRACRALLYKNVRFYFNGSLVETLWQVWWSVLLATGSLGLALPWAKRNIQRYLVDITWYGNKQCVSMPSLSDVFSPVLVLLFLLGVASALLLYINPTEGLTTRHIYTQPALTRENIAYLACLLAALAVCRAMYRTMNIRNYLRNSEVLSVAIFSFRRSWVGLYACELMYALLVLFSAGLACPWLMCWRSKCWTRLLIIRTKPGIDEATEMPRLWYEAQRPSWIGLQTVQWIRSRV